jgi:hypothetical protein
VVQAGLADRILPLGSIASELVQMGTVGRVAQLPTTRTTLQTH